MSIKSAIIVKKNYQKKTVKKDFSNRKIIKSQ